jgi:hypothetical protein
MLSELKPTGHRRNPEHIFLEYWGAMYMCKSYCCLCLFHNFAEVRSTETSLTLDQIREKAKKLNVEVQFSLTPCSKELRLTHIHADRIPVVAPEPHAHREWLI